MNPRSLAAAGLPDLAWFLADQPREPLFATVSGAHLYGFPSVDSDVDLRGVHLLELRELVGLRVPTETVTRMWDREGVEIDLVTHDLAKFARMMLKRNGYVLEQLLSPLVVHTTAEHAELLALAPACVTRHHARHYLGFATTQWALFESTGELKPLLYTFRALMTGIHMMQSGETEAHLPTLISLLPAPAYLAELIDAKRLGEHRPAREVAGAPSQETLATDVTHVFRELEDSYGCTALPDAPTAEPDLNALVTRVRLASRAN